MPHADSVIIILTSAHEPIGEVHAHRGAFQEAVFGDTGEEIFGSWFAEWQVRGLLTATRIPVRDGALAIMDRVPLRSSHFSEALRGWLEAAGYRSLVLPASALAEWHALEDRMNDPLERHAAGARLAAKTTD